MVCWFSFNKYWYDLIKPASINITAYDSKPISCYEFKVIINRTTTTTRQTIMFSAEEAYIISSYQLKYWVLMIKSWTCLESCQRILKSFTLTTMNTFRTIKTMTASTLTLQTWISYVHFTKNLIEIIRAWNHLEYYGPCPFFVMSWKCYRNKFPDETCVVSCMYCV